MSAPVDLVEEKAKVLREEVVKMLTNAGSGHSAGPLGSADFWATLFFGGFLRYEPQNPWWEERDRVVLSAGHYAPVLYAVLAEAGFFPKTELSSLRILGSRLQGHPVARKLPGVENTSGPLGQGISQAVGMALAAKITNKKWRVICFMGDGEQNEGQVWEAFLCAAKYRLDNLIVVIDRNNIQIDGHTEQVMPLEPFEEKLNSFGLETTEIDGHNIAQIGEALERATVNYGKPTAIILKTIPGKGVDFMENQPEWHGKAPSLSEAIEALHLLKRIRTLDGRIVND